MVQRKPVPMHQFQRELVHCFPTIFILMYTYPAMRVVASNEYECTFVLFAWISLVVFSCNAERLSFPLPPSYSLTVKIFTVIAWGGWAANFTGMGSAPQGKSRTPMVDAMNAAICLKDGQVPHSPGLLSILTMLNQSSQRGSITEHIDFCGFMSQRVISLRTLLIRRKRSSFIRIFNSKYWLLRTPNSWGNRWSQNRDTIMRDTVVENSGNFDHLGVHWHRTAGGTGTPHGPQHFAPIEMQPLPPGFVPGTFGSESECHRH